VLVYSPRYDFSLFGLERLHPFDARKFSRAWARLGQRLGSELERHWEEPKAPIADADLLLVHDAAYLNSLQSSSVIAAAIEVAPLALVPNALLQHGLLEPMRRAAAGTLLAAERALENGGTMAMNLGGGYHHAFRDHGEGFCLLADAAIAIAGLRARGLLANGDTIAVIDLDAHRGNGFWDIVQNDPAVHVLDMYNFQNYPGAFPGDRAAYPFQIPLRAGLADADYLAAVTRELPRFLASMPPPRLAIYNAGTDILAGDPIGGLGVSAEGVIERDRLVIDALVERRIPTVIVTSGGYTQHSHVLVAELAQGVIERVGHGYRGQGSPSRSR
jgi:histone deacetylase 11